jgi:hypothetical protein
MVLLAAKSLLAPSLIALATLVSLRWGDRAGGWVLGLPIASGPVSVLLFLEHGRFFAARAAQGALLGLVAAGIFCVVYLMVSERWSWLPTLLSACAACLGVALLLSRAELPLPWTILFVVTALLVLSLVRGDRDEAPASQPPTLRGTLMRMLVASVLVLAITTCSGWLGGTVSGLLAPLPVLGALMTASHHRRQGSRAVQRLVPGIAAGLWGGVAFFAVVAELVYRRAPSATYLAAACAAVLAVFLATRVAAAHPLLRLGRGLYGASHRVRRRAAHVLELARS